MSDWVKTVLLSVLIVINVASANFNLFSKNETKFGQEKGEQAKINEHISKAGIVLFSRKPNIFLRPYEVTNWIEDSKFCLQIVGRSNKLNGNLLKRLELLIKLNDITKESNSLSLTKVNELLDETNLFLQFPSLSDYLATIKYKIIELGLKNLKMTLLNEIRASRITCEQPDCLDELADFREFLRAKLGKKKMSLSEVDYKHLGKHLMDYAVKIGFVESLDPRESWISRMDRFEDFFDFDITRKCDINMQKLSGKLKYWYEIQSICSKNGIILDEVDPMIGGWMDTVKICNVLMDHSPKDIYLYANYDPEELKTDVVSRWEVNDKPTILTNRERIYQKLELLILVMAAHDIVSSDSGRVEAKSESSFHAMYKAADCSSRCDYTCFREMNELARQYANQINMQILFKHSFPDHFANCTRDPMKNFEKGIDMMTKSQLVDLSVMNELANLLYKNYGDDLFLLANVKTHFGEALSAYLDLHPQTGWSSKADKLKKIVENNLRPVCSYMKRYSMLEWTQFTLVELSGPLKGIKDLDRNLVIGANICAYLTNDKPNYNDIAKLVGGKTTSAAIRRLSRGYTKYEKTPDDNRTNNKSS